MATILFAWELGGGLGHCAKLAPLVSGLAARGHQVYFAAKDVGTAQTVFQHSEVKFLQAPGIGGRVGRTNERPRTFAQVLMQVGFGSDDQLRSQVVAWRNLIELVKPAAIVCEHSPAALLASRWFDLPTVVIGTGFSVPPDVSPLPDLCPWLGPPPADLIIQEARALDRVNRLLSADSHPPLRRLSQLHADADEQYLTTLAELDHHRCRGTAEYFGSWPLVGGARLDWPVKDGPRVFAYLKPPPGSARLEPTLGLLRELPISTLAYVPRASKSVLALQSPALRICSEPVDMEQVVAECDLAIVNGTAGTTTQCLLGGVPLLLLPHYLEQAVLSQRVVELGAGLAAPPHRVELQGGRLWKLLQDDCYRQAARGFADRYAMLDLKSLQNEVIDRVEALLTRPAYPHVKVANDRLPMEMAATL